MPETYPIRVQVTEEFYDVVEGVTWRVDDRDLFIYNQKGLVIARFKQWLYVKDGTKTDVR